MSYTEPPSTGPPPPDQQPRVVVRPDPPRELPTRDHAALDQQESVARGLTWAVGAAALIVAVIVVLVLVRRQLT